MRITKQTITALESKGIIVQNNPYRNIKDWYDVCWKKEYEWNMYYNKCFNHTPEQMEQDATKWANEHAPRDMNNWYDAELLYIFYEDRIIRKKVSVKSKLIDETFVLKEVEKDKKAYSGVYGKFAKMMSKLLEDNGIGNQWSVYPTTYGIGVWRMLNFNLNEDIKKVDEILNERGVVYRNEYSDREWVFRYVISKSEINKLKLLCHY